MIQKYYQDASKASLIGPPTLIRARAVGDSNCVLQGGPGLFRSGAKLSDQRCCVFDIDERFRPQGIRQQQVQAISELAFTSTRSIPTQFLYQEIVRSIDCRR